MIWTWLKLTQCTGQGLRVWKTEWPCPQILRVCHTTMLHTLTGEV